jgi:xanthine dehydrogenase accessory factor
VSYVQTLSALVEGGRGGTEAIVIDGEAAGVHEAARFLFDREGALVAARGGLAPPLPLREHLRAVAERPQPYIAQGVSYLPFLPRCRLVIVGGGHVGLKVAELAQQVDFDVWVVDDREDYCNPQRFPGAQRLLCGPIEDVLPKLEVDSDTFCIIVTRGHNHDETALFHLAEKPARYLGMIGSKRKIRLIFDDLRREGISDATLQHVHAPLGFDIGSQTVPEIAVSIVAELIAHRNLPGFHRDRIVRTAHSTV